MLRRAVWRQCHETGQAALTLVIAIVLLLVTSGGILAANAMAHDPLVQTDVVQHYAYRALEAGINSYLRTINEHPNLVNCNTTSISSTCKTEKYDQWFQVPETTVATDATPEWYLWTNPQLCFSSTATKDTSCTSSPSTGNLEYVQILVVGAAGTPGHYQYQQSVSNFSPENSFLTHLWWSDYEAEPSAKTPSRTACKWDWKNSYKGPGSSCAPGGSYTGAVFFGPGDVIDGPVYTNDSIYVASDPTFGTSSAGHPHPTAIDTADPSCIVVTAPGSSGSSPASACKSTLTATTGNATYTPTNSHFGLTTETPPSTDSSLETLAAEDGCVYSGPTTISFIATHTHRTGYMNVYSPLTQVTGTHDSDNDSSNHNTCLGTDIRLPDGTPSGGTSEGNGVIYVKTATGSCASQKVNPYDAYVTMTETVTVTVTEPVTVTVPEVVGRHWTKSRGRYVTTIVYVKEKKTEPVTTKQRERETFVTATRAQSATETLTPATMNCAGDAFVHDANSAPSGKESGMAGNLTIATANNVVITGAINYTDCQSGFNSEKPCTYNDGNGAVNDSLGLIANNSVVVNRPVCPNGKTSHSDPYCTSKGLLKRCASEISSTATWTTWEDALCNPSSGTTLDIDGALLALNHSFEVDNWTTGGATGKLVIYGTMDQYWRGPVGDFSNTTIDNGFSKYYTWDARLQYVSIPSYLSPNLPSWGLVASSMVLDSTCPSWPKRFPTGYKYVKTRTINTTTTFRTPSSKVSLATAPPPTGARCT